MRRQDVTVIAKPLKDIERDAKAIAGAMAELIKMISEKTGEDVSNIYIESSDRHGEDDKVEVLDENLLICGVLVKTRANTGAIWVTGSGDSEKIQTGPKEPDSQSLVPVLREEKVTRWQHPTFRLFRRHE